MSGTESGDDGLGPSVSAVFEVLNSSQGVSVLSELRKSISGKEKDSISLEECAVGLDSSVFLRVGGHSKSADLIDYLGSRHEAPVIVPAQTIQEFWNNHLSVVNTIADSVKRRFDELEKEVKKISKEFGDFADRMNRLIDEFRGEYGYIFDEATVRNTDSVLDMLMRRGSVIEVPRTSFCELAEFRNRTKTPPGFMDSGDGDFLVWVEFLVGLHWEKAEGREFQKVVFITGDQKKDWSRAGQPHPVLSAEVKKLVGVGLEVWSLDDFVKAVGDSVS